MKKVVSISLGSSKGDFQTTTNYLGQDFELKRIGANGDLVQYRRLLEEMDGFVDAIGLGGTDMYLFAGGRRYTFREIRALASVVKKTPVVDGSGLKNTLERQCIQTLKEQRNVDFASSNTLVVCAVDRFGLAEEIAAAGGPTVYGDMMFSLGLPVPVKSFRMVRVLARVLLPVIVQLPFKWLYPTGDKQDAITPKWEKWYDWADIIAGDRHIIRRYMPDGKDSLKGKIIITNTTTSEVREEFAFRGVDKLVTTTQSFEGRSPGTNVMEGVLVAALGRRPEELSAADYRNMIDELDWKPEITALQQADIAT